MFAWWYVVIILAALIIIGAVCWFIGWKNDLSMFYHDDEEFDWEIFGCVGMCICLMALCCEVVLFPVIIGISCNAKTEVRSFKYQKEYIASVVANADDLENIAISQTLIEQNQWLADVKARVELYGVWSAYYYAGVMELEPIAIEK